MGCVRSAASPRLGRGIAQSAGLGGLRPFTPDGPGQDEVAALLAELSPAARALLEHVDESGGEATAGSARHTVLPEDAATPAEELLARRLLSPRSGGQVWVPGEVSVALRGGHTTRERVDVVPTLATAERPAALVERTAAGAAFEVVRRSSCCSTTGVPTRRPSCAPAVWGCASSRPPPPTCTSTRPPRRCSWRSPPRLGCSRAATTRTATRSSPRPTTSTPGPACRRPSAGRGWRAPGGHQPPAGPGRHPGRRGQGALRPRPREHQRLRGRHPPVRARGDRGTSRTATCWRPAPGPASLVARLSLAASPPPALPRRPGGVGPARGDDPGPGRAGRHAGVRPGAARRRRPRAAPRAPAPGAGGPRAPPGGPDRRRPRSARARPGPPAAARGRGGVAGWGDGLPVHRPVRTSRARRRLDRGRAARVRGRRLPDPGPPAADVPHRRHRPHLRDRPGRSRRGLPPRRRRGRLVRAAGAPAGGLPRAASDRADRRHQHDAPRRAAPPAARDGRGAGRGGARRVAARRPARRAARKDAQGARQPPSARPASRRPSPG